MRASRAIPWSFLDKISSVEVTKRLIPVDSECGSSVSSSVSYLPTHMRVAKSKRRDYPITSILSIGDAEHERKFSKFY